MNQSQVDRLNEVEEERATLRRELIAFLVEHVDRLPEEYQPKRNGDYFIPSTKSTTRRKIMQGYASELSTARLVTAYNDLKAS